MKGIIYCATFPNGKRYIGQTVQPLQARISQHIAAAIHDIDHYAVHVAIVKYGKENIKWSILEDNIETIEELNTLEEYWIKEYDTYAPNGKGYNLTLGGNNFTDRYRFSEDEVYELFEQYKICGNANAIAQKYNTSSSVILNAIKRYFGDDYKQYSYNGQGSQFKFTPEEEQEIYDYFVLTGSQLRTVEKFNCSKRNLPRILERIDPNYQQYEWHYKINKEYIDDVYEDYKKIGRVPILAEKYHVSNDVIRSVLKYKDPNYLKYRQFPKRK